MTRNMVIYHRENSLNRQVPLATTHFCERCDRARHFSLIFIILDSVTKKELSVFNIVNGTHLIPEKGTRLSSFDEPVLPKTGPTPTIFSSRRYLPQSKRP